MADPCVPLEVLKSAAPVAAAAAAALVALVGWWCKSVISYCVWRDRSLHQRIELMQTIRAEIGINLTGEKVWASDAYRDGLLEKFDGPGWTSRGFVPYASTTSQPPLLDEFVKKLFLLPETVATKVFEYFNQSQALDAQVKDFRSEAFLGIGRQRQRDVLIDTYALGADTVSAGETAQKLLLEAVKIDTREKSLVPRRATIWTALAVSISAGLGWIGVAATFNAVEGWVATCSPPAALATTKPAAAP